MISETDSIATKNLAGLRYLYRSDKPRFCYHIRTERGSACKMENGNWLGKIDAFSATPPPGRKLCSMCANVMGVEIPKPIPADAPHVSVAQPRPDKILASFGVSMDRRDTEFQATNIRICQGLYVRLGGTEFPGLTWEKARSALGSFRKTGVLPPLPGGKKLTVPKQKKAKKPKAQKPPKPSVVKAILQPKKPKLTAERIAFIISNEFLQSFEWRHARYLALKESSGCCCLCGRGRPHGIILNVDHIKPRRHHPELALDQDNLQVLCHDCNHGKGSWDESDWR